MSKAVKAQKKRDKKTAKAVTKALKKALKQQQALPELSKKQRESLAQNWVAELLKEGKAPVFTLFPGTPDVMTPLKRRPCKGCPALEGRACKCAMKRMKRSA
ncbi:hypothetical protein [Ferrimonas balearica]|uniref:hypothetical protein n=1 Tax=Ferrimonas balearica TaxID=44012 RepID=UPI001F25F3E2|nr:hypothetical protein [Ferrimonas balearica]MBY6016284.1 hypothetical protein [Halomonas denitrificans]MBY6095447.1 hypothetical protein [Ferrimonas balearica]